MHETKIRVKHKGKWVDAGDLEYIRDTERPAAAPPPQVDVAALPASADLDPDMPLAQLWFEHPETRAYIAKDGKIRSGLTKEQRATGEEILKKYGGKA